jgi:hypothetical protein
MVALKKAKHAGTDKFAGTDWQHYRYCGAVYRVPCTVYRVPVYQGRQRAVATGKILLQYFTRYSFDCDNG